MAHELKNSEAGGPGRGALTAMVLALLVGLGIALYLASVKLRLEFDPTYVSSCNFGEKLNCDAVQTSEASSVFGYPLALYGAATYLAMILVLWLGAFRRSLGRALHAALGLGGLVVCGHSLYLAYVSTFVLGTYCLYCIAMYGVNLAVTGLALWSYRRRHGRWLDVKAVLGAPVASFAGLGLLALSLIVVLPTWDAVREVAKKARLADVQAELEEVEETAAKAQASEASKGAAAQPAGSSSQSTPRAARVGDVVTRKGRSIYDVPVTEEDWVLGPVDAPVTVVEFADFQCGYCRMLSQNIKPLKAKYKDEVRWVYKHFPMANSCNKVMKGERHPLACDAARASNCLGEQGLFWAAHDRLYAHQHKLNVKDLRDHAEALKADLAAYDSCMARPGPDPRIVTHSQQGRVARISGTPRSYINGNLVPGVNATEVMDYYIQSALKQALARPAPVAAVGVEAQHGMVQAKTASGDFWIDAYEASVDGDGRALSQAGVRPALISWLDASAACKKAGKRLCTEEEWVSACTGTPAVDNDEDGVFTDDDVEGWLFPYGPFHVGLRCHDNEPKRGGAPKATGIHPECKGPTGIFDQSGNVSEWTGVSVETAVLTGSYFAYGQKSGCRGRSTKFGPGYRNETTGFRCCSDGPPVGSGPAATPVDSAKVADVGVPAPAFVVRDGRGRKVTEKALRGKITVVSFFASWCGICRRELPELETFYQAKRGDGLQVIAMGVDTDPEDSKAFAEGMDLSYTVVYDPDAVVMGRFGIKGMPTALALDAQGVIRAKLVGMKAEKLAAFKATVETLLKAP